MENLKSFLLQCLMRWKAVRGKKWYTGTTFLLSLLIPDVRDTLLSRAHWLIHVPDTLLGKWEIIIAAFVLIGVGAWRGHRRQNAIQSAEREALAELVKAPREVMRLVAALQFLETAKIDISLAGPKIAALEKRIDELEHGPARRIWDSEAWELGRSVQDIFMDLSAAASGAGMTLDVGQLKSPTPNMIQTEDLPTESQFLPANNAAYFSEHRHNLYFLKREFENIKAAIDQRPKEILENIREVLQVRS